MLTTTAYKIRLATDEDAAALSRLAELDSSAPLATPIVVGDIAGAPAAALSLADGRVIADPFRRTGHLVACLRIYVDGLRAYEAQPSVSDRIRAALRPARRAGAPASA